MADIRRGARDQPSKSEPDFLRMPAIDNNDISSYLRDARNLSHHLLSWQECPVDACQLHYTEKVHERWFPSPTSKCIGQWYDCKNDLCPDHLWDKREEQHFPGETSAQFSALKFIVINKNCLNPCWQRCLNSECSRHQEAKHDNGFHLDDRFEREYQYESSEEEEPFLGQRRRAPGIDPSIPWGPIASSHSISN